MIHINTYMKPNMYTMILPYEAATDEVEDFTRVTNEIRREQSSAYRVAYNQARYGVTESSIEDHLETQSRPSLDSWYIRSAMKHAVGQFKADFERAKQQKLDESPKRIFGGKKNFQRRAKGLISKEEYQQNRLERLMSIGEANQRGNRKFDFNARSITFKPRRGVAFELILPELRGKYKEHYDQLVVMAHNKGIPITVQLDEKNIYLSFDLNKLNPPVDLKVIKGRYLGIDLNPNYIGVSYFNENKELIECELYNFNELTGKNINADKLKHEMREVAIRIGNKARHYQIEYLFVEELNFGQGDKRKGKNFNRLTGNQFLHNEFKRMLAKFGTLKEVNAAYSSTIGNIVYSNYPDPIAASMEIARRGIESRIVISSGKFYPPMISSSVLHNRWKEHEVPEFDTWIDLHRWIKQSGLKYRVDIPGVSMFRELTSHKSGVLIYGFVT